VKRPVFSKLALAAAVLLAAVTTVGCAHKKQPDAVSSISGTLTYRDDISLSPNAVAYVRLADLSDKRKSDTTVIQQEVRPDGQLPIPFTLSYKDKWINPSHEYTIDVRVVDNGKLLFISDQKQPVITNGHSNTASVVLHRIGSSSNFARSD
jgi:putative lipoprotein